MLAPCTPGTRGPEYELAARDPDRTGDRDQSFGSAGSIIHAGMLTLPPPSGKAPSAPLSAGPRLRLTG